MYLRPGSIEEAVAALAAARLAVIAGGTDFYPARVGRAIDEDLLDVTGIAALHGIATTADGWRIGAATSWTEIAEAALPPLFDGLRAASREIGGRQIQNAGTLGGNLCNASPAADGVPCLLALDAAVELASARGRRVLPLPEFVRGNRATALGRDELLTAILVPRPAGRTVSAFGKLGARRYLVISIVMAAATLELDAAGRIEAARVAVGACSAAAQRLPELEAALAGRQLAPGVGAAVEPAQLDVLAPIDDVRGTAAYRRDAALTLVARTLERLAGGAG